MNKVNSIIPEYQFDKAVEFWEFLAPYRYILRPDERLIFRGQADSTWHLEPSILRGQNHPVYSQPSMRSVADRADYQIIAEVGALKTFADHCDSSGLQIPGMTAKFKREYLDTPQAIFTDVIVSQTTPWPLEEYFELMSVAQHFGLPTRLLDWTGNPYVAAFFAASELALKSENVEGERLAVWAFDIQKLAENVTLIRVPSSGNQNIAAQRGIFTLLRQPYAVATPFEGTHSLDEHMATRVTVQGKQRLVKITVPQSECCKILDLCNKHSLTSATLQPDFYGAAKATKISLAITSRCKSWDCSDVKINKQPFRYR